MHKQFRRSGWWMMSRARTCSVRPPCVVRSWLIVPCKLGTSGLSRARMIWRMSNCIMMMTDDGAQRIGGSEKMKAINWMID